MKHEKQTPFSLQFQILNVAKKGQLKILTQLFKNSIRIGLRSKFKKVFHFLSKLDEGGIFDFKLVELIGNMLKQVINHKI